MHTISQWWMWAGFFVFIAAMIVIDMFFLGGKKTHRVSTKEASLWVFTWFSLAMVFNLILWQYLSHTLGETVGAQKGLEFFTGYLIEESLSIDNMFVFVLIFNYFAVPMEYQRRVLLYGVIGAIVLRLITILLGVYLVSKFQWILYFFGALLVFTGIKMLVFADEKPDLAKNPFLNWMRKHLRVTDSFHEENFFVKKNGLLFVTPLFLVLVLIEISDVIFAVDSIPAIFAVTSDPFIVFTSNIFAILGLRALYFLLANMAERFHLLKYGVALILVFIGFKMLLAYWYHIPILIALSVVGIILTSSVVLSWWKTSK